MGHETRGGGRQGDLIAALAEGSCGLPFEVLGPQRTSDGRLRLRAFRPQARELFARNESTGERVRLRRTQAEGYFTATVRGDWSRYSLEEHNFAGRSSLFADPYAFRDALLTDYDRYLYGQGSWHDSYEKLGAHMRSCNGVEGVNFAVWAPNAWRVSVVGDFNDWDPRTHPMQPRGDGGIHELFVPGQGAGVAYKYDVVGYGDYNAQKADPYAFRSELRPKTASIVTDLSGYAWGDEAWMAGRSVDATLQGPMLIYEIHAGSWRRRPDGSLLNFRELAQQLIPWLCDMGYTHVEFLPLAEHPLDASWGYQVSGYHALSSRYGEPQDFMAFVDACHQAGIGVLLDWVPAHFPRDGHGLSQFDGTYLYSHADPRLGEQPQWGTRVFNFGRNEVRNFLLSNALFWLRTYHVDGLRVDAVSSMLYLNFGREESEWLTNEEGGHENLDAIRFLRDFNVAVHREAPGAITIAEEASAWPGVSLPVDAGGLGFTLKWNMGWMNDTLAYLRAHPADRHLLHQRITFSLMYAFSENFVLPFSHDEVVHLKGSMLGKIAGDWWQQFATLRTLYLYMLAHPGKKLAFMGLELGEWQEWSETRGLDWNLLQWPHHRGLYDLVRRANHLYRSLPALWQRDFEDAGFRWIDVHNARHSSLAWSRLGRDPADTLLALCNFSDAALRDYRVGVAQPGPYTVLLNSDDAQYGGSGSGAAGRLEAEARPAHGQDFSLLLDLPALSALWLQRVPED